MVSSRLIRKEFPEQLQKYYWNPVLWSRAYCLLTAGGAPIEILREYIEVAIHLPPNHRLWKENSANAVKLTESERQLMANNTEDLLLQFRKNHTTKVLEEKKTDKELMAIALKKTKEDFRTNKGLDPELTGWSGWVKFDSENLFKELKANRDRQCS